MPACTLLQDFCEVKPSATTRLSNLYKSVMERLPLCISPEHQTPSSPSLERIFKDLLPRTPVGFDGFDLPVSFRMDLHLKLLAPGLGTWTSSQYRLWKRIGLLNGDCGLYHNPPCSSLEHFLRYFRCFLMRRPWAFLMSAFKVPAPWPPFQVLSRSHT